MEMEACRKVDLEFEVDGLIDDKQFSGLITEKEGDDRVLISETGHLHELCESIEPQQNEESGRCNLRKSLAWDSAFFTSAGVLDAEELSTMMTGSDKGETHLLPGIQEEITGSIESLSTIKSDTFMMETLDEDLFVDIRASIQRSSKKAFNSRISSSKAAAIDDSAISSLEKEESIPQNKNQKPGAKKTSSLQTVRMSRCQPKQNNGKLVTGKATKQNPIQSQTSIAKIGGAGSTLVPKQPKTISSSIPSSTAAGKRDSVGIGHTKSGIMNPAIIPGKGTQLPKLSSSGGARSALPKTAPSSSSSPLPSSTTSSLHSRRSSSSSDSSSNISSKIPSVKSSLIPARMSIGKASKSNTGPGSIRKTPSRVTPKHKLPSSLPKISSNISPASSISEWSSASSSSSLMVNLKFNNFRNSVDTNSCRSTDSDSTHLDPMNPSVGQAAVGSEYQSSIKSTTPISVKTQAPGKPSGLRMPSHKFGFFDGAKSSIKSSDRHQQSSSPVQNGFPKNGPSVGTPVRNSYAKIKTAKVSTPKIVNSQKITSPASSHVKQLTGINNSPSLSFGSKVTSISSEETRTEYRAEQVCANMAGAIIEESLGGLKIEAGDMAVNEGLLQKENDYGSKYQGGWLTRDDEKGNHENSKGPTDGLLLSDVSARASMASTMSETCRVPLAPKNSFVSGESAELAKELVDKTGFILPAFELKENT